MCVPFSYCTCHKERLDLGSAAARRRVGRYEQSSNWNRRTTRATLSDPCATCSAAAGAGGVIAFGRGFFVF